MKITNDIAQEFPGYQVELAGSSLGGGIAQFVALETGLQGKVFNSLALGSTILNHLAEHHPTHNPGSLISHVNLAGEVLNDDFFGLSPYLIQGAMSVKGYKMAVPNEVAAKIDGYLPGLNRHWAGATVKVMEYYLGQEEN